MEFKIQSNYQPSGDQPIAISALVDGLNQQKKHQVLLGVTGSGKTFSIANVIEQVKRPTLVLAHNKTLAAQLCAEFKEFFPENSVEYFVSYYDYYQPEAYVSSRDLYIEKEAQINEEIERLRHSATRALFTRRDVIIVASVSCIYGLGTPEEYLKGVLSIQVGNSVGRRELMAQLTDIYYERNDIELKRGRFRVKGDCIDIFPSWDETAIRVELFGDEVDRMFSLHPVSGDVLNELSTIDIFPASHYVVSGGMEGPIDAIKNELNHRHKELLDQGLLVEAQRLKQRTMFDVEMMRQMGYCKGIENYSRHISGKPPGEHPGSLLDFFPDDFLMVIDESHVSLPQVRGMFKGDRSRKQSLVDFGFRLPSALDNRPLMFEEFEQKMRSVIYVSATPGPYELDQVVMPNPVGDSLVEQYDVVEQVNRPTGLLDPKILLRTATGQMDDLLGEINVRVDKNERVLVTTVTKQLSEDIANFLADFNIKVRYLHSDIETLERIDILRDLRLGEFDVLVGVNLLREGLDLPEVSLVAILDADKEGFLRNERSLIQTMGRAARHVDGTVILYADKRTPSMQKAIDETNRRRKKQEHYNKSHGITPMPIVKAITNIRDDQRKLVEEMDQFDVDTKDPKAQRDMIAKLQKEMHDAADNLEFELAAVLRDKIDQLSISSPKSGSNPQ